MFMDDLKVSPSSTKTRYLMRKYKMYEGSAAKLTRTMGKVNDVSEAIRMILGLRKCAVVQVRGGEVVWRGQLKLKPGMCMCELTQGQTYRYLGVHQLITAEVYKTRGSVRREYKRRVQRINYGE